MSEIKNFKDSNLVIINIKLIFPMLNGTATLWECLGRLFRIAFTASVSFLLNNAYLVQLGKKKKKKESSNIKKLF